MKLSIYLQPSITHKQQTREASSAQRSSIPEADPPALQLPMYPKVTQRVLFVPEQPDQNAEGVVPSRVFLVRSVRECVFGVAIKK